MRKDREAFRKRFQRWKNGEKVYDNGRPTAIQEVDKSDADFAKRLRSNWREEIWDWEKSGKAVTHKIGGFDNIIYPNVQTTKCGGLIDFTNPIWKGNVDPAERALRNGDYVPMKTEQDAIWFGPNYKDYYPGFEDGKTVDGGVLPEITVTGEKRRHSIIDKFLWKADRAGAPSHVTNALRDFSNRVQNFPIIAADAIHRYSKGGYDNIFQAYKDADVNPSKTAKKMLVYPYTNDQNNYSKEELAAMKDLVNKTGMDAGDIGYKAYRMHNGGRYAGDINPKNFNDPHKVAEWSLGQTKTVNDGTDKQLYDDFSYDVRDTKGVYLKGILTGNTNPIMGLRSLFGIIGSKGYNDGSNSATSIKTRIPVGYLQNK